jgi:hypothetical protein
MTLPLPFCKFPGVYSLTWRIAVHSTRSRTLQTSVGGIWNWSCILHHRCRPHPFLRCILSWEFKGTGYRAVLGFWWHKWNGYSHRPKKASRPVLNLVHRLNVEGHYAEFLNAECWMPKSWTPNGTECRIPEPRMGLNAEILYAELDLMLKFCMPNWTQCRIPECQNLECRIGLNAEILNAELDWMPISWMYLRWKHTWWVSMYDSPTECRRTIRHSRFWH